MSFHLRIEFDCRPGAIAQSLALREPKYQETAAYCHFGREPVTKTLSLHLSPLEIPDRLGQAGA